jgi:hypothetical protein
VDVARRQHALRAMHLHALIVSEGYKILFAAED